MYRTKELNLLMKIFKPVLNTVELYIDSNGFIRRIGSDEFNEVKDPNNYVYDSNSGKKFIFISNELQFHYYKDNKDTCELFNPFIKYKNALSLLMLMLPIIYYRFCKSNENLSDEEFSTFILDDEFNLSPEDLEKYISVVQYPKDKKTGMSKIECICRDDNGDNINFSFESDNKIINVFAIMIQIITYLDYEPKFIKENKLNGDEDLYNYITELLESYMNERTRNKKDFIKTLSENSSDIENLNLSDNFEEYEKEISEDEQKIDIAIHDDEKKINYLDSDIHNTINFDYDHQEICGLDLDI